LEYHNLLQAFSRTYQVEENTRPYGNIGLAPEPFKLEVKQDDLLASNIFAITLVEQEQLAQLRLRNI